MFKIVNFNGHRSNPVSRYCLLTSVFHVNVSRCIKVTINYYVTIGTYKSSI